MDNRPIGVFDSGLGGLTAVRAIRDLMPGEDIVYLGDNGRLPYGSKSAQIIRRYAAQDIAFLVQQGVKWIVAACGTVSSSVTPREGEELAGLPYFGVVNPAARAACEATRNGRIGVIATGTSIASGSFEKAIRALNPDIQVYAQGCNLLVSLVENGFIGRNEPLTVMAVQRYLEPILREGVDTLILGCTHFPILCDIIKDIAGDGVALIDPCRETVLSLSMELAGRDMLHSGQEKAAYHYYVTDINSGFQELAELLMSGALDGHVHRVDLE